MGKTPREQYAEKHGEKAAREIDRELLESCVAAAAQMILDALKAEDAEKLIGFTLVMFDVGNSGSMAYASTADRADFLRLLDELRGKLANETPGAPKGD